VPGAVKKVGEQRARSGRQQLFLISSGLHGEGDGKPQLLQRTCMHAPLDWYLLASCKRTHVHGLCRLDLSQLPITENDDSSSSWWWWHRNRLGHGVAMNELRDHKVLQYQMIRQAKRT
jgi:hypothetical protein